RCSAARSASTGCSTGRTTSPCAPPTPASPTCSRRGARPRRPASTASARPALGPGRPGRPDRWPPAPAQGWGEGRAVPIPRFPEERMARWRPDPTFYPTPRMAMDAPPETLAYVVLSGRDGHGGSDAIGVIDTDPASPEYGRLVGKVEFPNGGNELHHFGWNACSSHLCPYAPQAHIERRYLIVPGIRSSNIFIVDTRPEPRNPRLVKVIEGEEVMRKTGYAAPHTVHCGPDGIYMNALGAPDGNGPGGIFMLDHETFEVKGRWEKERGPQQLSYDFWWHLGYDTMISSEWGTPNMVKDGVNPELLLGGKY